MRVRYASDIAQSTGSAVDRSELLDMVALGLEKIRCSKKTVRFFWRPPLKKKTHGGPARLHACHAGGSEELEEALDDADALEAQIDWTEANRPANFKKKVRLRSVNSSPGPTLR